MAVGKRMGRQDWLDIGLEALADSGSDSLTLEKLCHRTGRTRGSFYHHFEDHDSFLSQLANCYRHRFTDRLIENTQSGDVDERLMTLNQLATALDSRLETAIRQLAQSSSVVNEVLRDVDAARIDYLTELYATRDIEDGLARRIAHIEYAAFIGHKMIWPDAHASDEEAAGVLFGQMAALYCARES